MRPFYAIIFATALALQQAFAAQPSLQPLQTGRYNTSGTAFSVEVSGNYAYVGDGPGLQVVDVSDPQHPVRVGGYNDGSLWGLGVRVSGNYAYIATGGGDIDDQEFVIIDVSNPTNCVKLAGVSLPGESCAVAVAGNYVYVADNEYLEVIDVSNPANAFKVGGYGGVYSDVAVSGNYVYVASWQNGSRGLKVIDVSNPTNCVFVGEYLTNERALGVAVAGHYAYLVNGVDGLQVIDVSDPTHCVRVGGYDTPGFARHVAVSNNLAYVADDTSGLLVIDVSNPTNCVRVGGYDTSGSAQAVTVVTGKIYVADGEAGLLVLPTVPNVQFTVRTKATPGVPFTIEAATNLVHPIAWSPLLTTNVPTMPFDYVDFDVKLSDKPRKFYRVVQ